METIHAPLTGVSELFTLYGSQYRSEHKLPLQQHKTMFAIEHCRTAAMGGHIDKCDHCGHLHISYNSCRNRHCPKCQGLNSLKWVDQLAANLLPVSYFHIVFTLPSELNRLSLVNQKCVYDILFKAASESLLMLAKDPKYLHAATGLVAVLHTWGQTLMEHPHLHTLVPGGGWSAMAQSWKPSRRKFFIPVKVISAVFRGKFLSLLRTAYNEGQLKFEGEIKPLRLKNNFNQFLDLLYRKPWVVYAKKPFRKATHIIQYLGRYTHRVAISNNRIMSIENGLVTFSYKDYKERGSKKRMTIPANEFIRRFLLHVLPKGFCKIRYYGIFSSRNRKAIRSQCLKALGPVQTKSKYAGMSWQQILQAAFGINVCLCPVCKTGTMQTILSFKNNKAPPSL